MVCILWRTGGGDEDGSGMDVPAVAGVAACSSEACLFGQGQKFENADLAVKVKQFYDSRWTKFADNIRQVRLALKEDLLAQLRPLLWRIYSDYADFVEEKVKLGTSHPEVVAPGTGCSCIEGAFMWMGGWRPVSGIMLASSTLEMDPAAGEELKLELDALQRRTQQVEAGISTRVKEHEMLNSDDVVKTLVGRRRQQVVGADVKDLEAAIQPNLPLLAGLVMEAEQLRLYTLKELLETLTPQQGAGCLVAAYEILFSLRQLSSEKHFPSQVQKDGYVDPADRT